MITAYGIFVPWMLVGSILTTIGTGLIYTLDIGSPSSKWIGYQALAGIGIGFAFQVPIIANQAFVKMSEISSVTAVTLCESTFNDDDWWVRIADIPLFSVFQTIGGAFFVSAGQTAFANRLLSRVPITAPGVSPGLVVATGATQLRNAFPKEDIAGILVAYMDGLKVAFALAIALAGIAVPICVFTRWENIKPKTGGEGGAV